MKRNRYSIHNMNVHIVWITKYRYHVLEGDVQLRYREILKQVCNRLDIRILKGGGEQGSYSFAIYCLSFLHISLSL